MRPCRCSSHSSPWLVGNASSGGPQCPNTDTPMSCSSRDEYHWLWSVRITSGPPQSPAWRRPGVLAILQHLHTIDEDMAHAGRVLVRLVERRTIGDLGRIEDHHVGEHAFADEAAPIELEVRG